MANLDCDQQALIGQVRSAITEICQDEKVELYIRSIGKDVLADPKFLRGGKP